MINNPKDVFEFDESKLEKVKVTEVRPNTWNPKRKDNVEYQKVKDSVRINGLTQPIFVRENDNGDTKYEILDGEHRHRAAVELGLEYIYIYNEGIVPDSLAKSLTLWHEVSVSIDEDMLKPLVLELNKENIEIPFTDIAISTTNIVNSYEEGKAGNMQANFGVPPFSFLDTRQGYWAEGRKKWIDLGIKSEIGRNDDLLGAGLNTLNQKTGTGLSGTSIFDPFLCEIMYKWFCPVGGTVIDPFGGGQLEVL